MTRDGRFELRPGPARAMPLPRMGDARMALPTRFTCCERGASARDGAPLREPSRRARSARNAVSAALGRPSVGTQGLVSGMRRALAWFVLGVLPVATFGAILVMSFRSGVGAWALDFNGNFTIPAHDILRGVSPYDPQRISSACATPLQPARSPTSSPRACS